MPTLTKPTFRQLLLLAFVLAAALLSATSLRALSILEQTAVQSRSLSDAAVRQTEAVERLNERTQLFERSLRQFLVLDDASFLLRARQSHQDATEAVQWLAANAGGDAALATSLRDWTRLGETVGAALGRDLLRDRGLQATVFEQIVRLRSLNEQIAQESRHELERRNDALLDELDRERRNIAVMVAVAIGAAALIALALAGWLARPLAQIEAAIHRLGEGRLEAPIAVRRGPADLRRLGVQLDWLRLRLAELDADKARFVSHVSHELKTPLASLREGVALLEDEVPGVLNTGQREVVDILANNVAALQRQIEDLLRYHAMHFSARALVRVPIDLQALIASVIEAQRLQWQALALTVGVEGGAPAFDGDADKLGAVIGNLLSNAIRFSPRGGAIRFVLARTDGATMLDCIDQGPGVADADAARIFQPFVQGERQPGGARRGSGLGLSIVSEYLAAHGGRIVLLPSAKGAHFRIELPDESTETT
ncbi:sensor histidine kinase [Jeongeupia chitinilytica]|uniref:Signal transduction histidine-protein kinase/phosphatase MprB n=1 Tax=Jeongeupia chitinilytica TaxID=1041641 RepID=A0ABQ3H3G6_9NEIS|nr:HAMP domain-containing sensor histidine kinase [Jeongeupia chitinilytica]GHD68528.1 two-component sensor histidine kinase [Jeongeupia chitinilytica]